MDLVKKEQDNEQGSVTNKHKRQNMTLSKDDIQLDNVPNPFNHETLISYSFSSEFSKASLRITDALGRAIREIPVHKPYGKVPFEEGSQNAGIYYVSLIVDGAIVKSKTMLMDR